MTKVVCMYSYKGGAGRTVASANISAILAKELKRKVVCIDMDIEGAGLGVVFGVNNMITQGNSKTIQDVLNLGTPPIDRESYKKYWKKDLVIDIGQKFLGEELSEKLFFIGARPGVSDIVILADPARIRMSQLIRTIETIDKPDYIIFDSAAGLSDPACMSLRYSNIILVFFRWSNQFVIGMLDCIEWISKYCDEAVFLFVPSVQPRLKDDEEDLKSLFKSKKILIEGKIKTLIESSEADNSDRKEYSYKLVEGIHESNWMKWQEEILAFKQELKKDEEEVLESYRTLARHIDQI